MKRLGKTAKTVTILALAVILMVVLCSCGKKEKEEYNGYYLYYIDKSNNKLVSEKYTSEKQDTIELIEELINRFSEDGKESKRVLPKKVTVNSYNLLDGILTLDFNSEYSGISSKKEVLMRAAIVLTLTQIESVDYVAFTINDEPVLRKDGTMLGNMQSGDFVDNLGHENNISSVTRFVLYYVNEDGSKLKEYDLTEDYYGDKSKEEYIVEKLIEGPKKEGYISTLSPETDLINVITTDNICYVNFGENFLSEQTGVPADLAIYSIVNSLSELNYVHKVQICVNGETNVSYNGNTLENPFIRNLDYIEAEK